MERANVQIWLIQFEFATSVSWLFGYIHAVSGPRFASVLSSSADYIPECNAACIKAELMQKRATNYCF